MPFFGEKSKEPEGLCLPLWFTFGLFPAIMLYLWLEDVYLGFFSRDKEETERKKRKSPAKGPAG